MRFLSTALLLGLAGFVPAALGAQDTGASSAPPQKAGSATLDTASAFPPRMQSYPLYGDGAIPNSKPGPDEETGADRGFVEKVSRPQIQVYLPARSRATGASVLIFPGGGYRGLTCGTDMPR